MKRDLNAILTVIAKGYDVIIKINRIDIGIRGQKLESVKLFGKHNPMASVLPEDMEKLVCLEEGGNSISVHLKRTDATSSSEFSIELQAREQFVNGANLFSQKEKIDVGSEKEISGTFTL